MVCSDVNRKNVSEDTQKMQQLRGMQRRKQLPRRCNNYMEATQKMQQLHGMQGRKQEKYE